MVGKTFVSVAHNFENENLLYFMVVEGNLVSLVDEMCMFKEIKPRADLPHEPTTLPDLIIFTIDSQVASSFVLNNLVLKYETPVFIHGFFQEYQYRTEDMGLEDLLSTLKKENGTIKCLRTPPDDCATYFDKEWNRSYNFANCFTLDRAAQPGLSGSPILNEAGEVVGMVCLSTVEGKIPRCHSITGEYIYSKFPSVQ